MKWGIISNLEGKSKVSDDNCTEMMTAESLDLRLSAFLVNASVGCCKEWSIVVNNTRYIGSERLKGKSSFVVTDKIKDDCGVQCETKKERNRRLLCKHQESYGRPVNVRLTFTANTPGDRWRYVKRVPGYPLAQGSPPLGKAYGLRQLKTVRDCSEDSSGWGS